MSEFPSMKPINRRQFIQRMGLGIAGTAVAAGRLNAEDTVQEKDIHYPHYGEYPITINVNGMWVKLKIAPETMLIDVLRDTLELTGTKKACGQGQCGACTVLLNDKPVYSCHFLALDADGKSVLTIEGLSAGGELHPVQKAFVKHDGLQCGFCTPGQVMAVQGILNQYKKPTPEQIKQGLSGNICRCSAYPKILQAAMDAAVRTS